MNGDEESDRIVVSMNQANKATEEQTGAAELGEKRMRTEENTSLDRTSPAQNGKGVSPLYKPGLGGCA